LLLDTRHFIGTLIILAVAFSLARDGDVFNLIVDGRRRAVRFSRRWLRHFKMVVDEGL
jgi:hypothetical protein